MIARTVPRMLTIHLDDLAHRHLVEQCADWEMSPGQYIAYLIADDAACERCARATLRRERQPRRRRQGAAPQLRLVRQPNSDTAS